MYIYKSRQNRLIACEKLVLELNTSDGSDVSRIASYIITSKTE